MPPSCVRESAQRAACAGRHTAEQRCARWLLTVADRIGRSSFPMTQRLMADTIGVRRATVVDVLGTLERAGVLSNTYGAIAIRDRAGLAAAACECYAVLRNGDAG